MRGQGHSTYGQAQAAAGVVIDSTPLAAVHEIRSGSAVVDAGVTWHALARQTVAVGLAPPVLPTTWTCRSAALSPFVQLPPERTAFLFLILRTTVPPTTVEQQLADNRVLYERTRDVGGKRYPIGSVRLTPADWVDHFGRDYPAFVAAKAVWDPRRVLTPGQRIFGPPGE